MTRYPSSARRLFLGGQSVSSLGDGCAVLAVPLLVLHLTSDPLAAGLAAAPRGVGYLLVGLPAGPIVDRLNPWSVLVVMDLARAGVFVALPALAWLEAAGLWIVLGLAFLGGAATVFYDAALAVAVKDLFPTTGLLRANSVLETAAQTAHLLGPAAVGLLAAAVGIEVALLVNALTFLVSLATLLPLLTAGRPAGTAGGPARSGPARKRGLTRGLAADFREGLRFLIAFRPLLVLTVIQTLVNLCLAVDTLIVYFARVTLSLPVPVVGAVVAAGGVGGIAGAATAALIVARIRALPSITLGIMIVAGSLLVMGVSATWWPLLLANAVQIWAVTVAGVVCRSTRQAWIPLELMGRVTTAVRAMFVAVTPIGAAIAGAVTKSFDNDPRPVFIAAGVLIAVIMGLGWCAGLRRFDAALPERP